MTAATLANYVSSVRLMVVFLVFSHVLGFYAMMGHNLFTNCSRNDLMKLMIGPKQIN